MDAKALSDIIKANPLFTESRITSLYSNFARLKAINIDGYRANVTAWKSVFLEAIKQHAFEDSIAIEANLKLIRAVAHARYSTPIALNSVFDELVKDGTLIPASRFMSSSYPLLTRSLNATKMALGLATWVGSFVFNTDYVSGDLDRLKDEKYIVVDTLKQTSENLLKSLMAKSQAAGNSYSSTTFSKEQLNTHFDRQTADLGLSGLDIDACLLYLSRETGKIAYDRKRGVIRLGPGKITDNDVAVASLTDQLSKAEARANGLAERKAIYEDKAKRSIRDNHKDAARHALKTKATIEKSHSQAIAVVDQLRTVLDKVDEAKDQEQTIAALTQGSDLLATINKEVGGIDRVSDLMDKIQEDISDTDAVTQELASVSLSNEADLEIDEELEALEAENKKTSQAAAKAAASKAQKMHDTVQTPEDEEMQDLLASLNAPTTVPNEPQPEAIHE